MISAKSKLFTIFFLVLLVSTSFVILSDSADGAGTSYYYNANGGSGAPSGGSVTLQVGVNSTNLTISSTIPTYPGYVFSHWNTSSSDTGTTYVGGDTYVLARGESITFYAIWIASPHTHTLAYNGGFGSSGAPSAQTVTNTSSTATFTISSVIPSKGGNYNFLGWSLSSNATTATYHGGDTITVNSATLYAVYQDNSPVYTTSLTYNANGGTNAPSVQTITSSSISKNFTISSTIPVYSGHIFLGWSLSSNATTATYHAGVGDSLTVSENTTLYAVWSAANTDHLITVSSSAITSVLAGDSYSYTLSYTCDINCSIAWTIPSWMSISSDYKTISGTAPNDVSSVRLYTVIVKIYNENSSIYQNYTLTVTPDASDLNITSLGSYSVGSTGKLTFVPSTNIYGATFGYTGDLPEWISFNPSGYFYGVSPLIYEDADYSFTVTATLSSVTVSKLITIKVLAYDPDVDLVGSDEITTKTFVFYFVDYTDFFPVNAVIWDFGDGNGSTDFEAQHTYAKAGDYVVRCTYFNDFGSSYVESGIHVTDEMTIFDSFCLWIAVHYLAVIVGFAVLIMIAVYTYPRVKSRKGVKRL